MQSTSRPLQHFLEACSRPAPLYTRSSAELCSVSMSCVPYENDDHGDCDEEEKQRGKRIIHQKIRWKFYGVMPSQALVFYILVLKLEDLKSRNVVGFLRHRKHFTEGYAGEVALDIFNIFDVSNWVRGPDGWAIFNSRVAQCHKGFALALNASCCNGHKM